jgi:hypothetical protein
MRSVLLVFALWGSLSNSIADNSSMPVMVGSDDDIDACASVGEVAGLTPGGDGFLAVRSGAGTHYRLVDKLLAGQQVFICDSSTDNKWLGVVYSKNGQNCGVSTPIIPAQPYKGRCKSGWVSSRWIKVIAG